MQQNPINSSTLNEQKLQSDSKRQKLDSIENKYHKSVNEIKTMYPVASSSGYKQSTTNENDTSLNFMNASSSDYTNSRLFDDTTASNSITIYEDDEETSMNRSIKNKKETYVSKRSPLTIVTMNSPVHKKPQAATSRSEMKRIEMDLKLKYAKSMQKIDYLSRLSDEIVLHILQFLPKKALFRLSLVSKRMCRLTHDESLWIRMDLGCKAIRSGAMGMILERGFVILRLAQAKITSPVFEKCLLNDEFFQSKLQFLDLSLAAIDTLSLKQLLSKCRLLKKLSLEHVRIDSEVCKEISENKNLEALNLAMCFGIDSDGMKFLVDNLNKLLTLNISWTQLNLESLTILVCKVTSKLTRLNLAGCRETLEDRHLDILIKRCPNLAELDLSDCPKLTKMSIEMLSGLKHIEYLSLSRCYNIDSTSYLQLNHIKSLKFLDIFGLLTDQAMKTLEKSIRNISINKFVHSSVARPTVMPRRTSIWGLKTRD